MQRILLAAVLPLAGFGLVLPSHGAPKKPLDPNETVCENQELLGSRLAVRRVCLTRAQWAEKQRDEHALVDRSQTQLCVAEGGLCSRGH